VRHLSTEGCGRKGRGEGIGRGNDRFAKNSGEEEVQVDDLRRILIGENRAKQRRGEDLTETLKMPSGPARDRPGTPIDFPGRRRGGKTWKAQILKEESKSRKKRQSTGESEGWPSLRTKNAGESEIHSRDALLPRGENNLLGEGRISRKKVPGGMIGIIVKQQGKR